MKIEDWIEERLAVDPKGTIKNLLDQTKRQAKTIKSNNDEIEKLKKEVSRLEGLLE